MLDVSGPAWLRSSLGMKALLPIALSLWTLLAGASEHHKDWDWPKSIPAYANITNVPATSRDSRTFDALRITRDTKVEDIIRTVGVPDSFSKMLMYSFRQGVPPISLIPDAGTFCYFLADGGAVHVQVGSDHAIQTCIRFERDGKGHLFYK